MYISNRYMAGNIGIFQVKHETILLILHLLVDLVYIKALPNVY